MNKEVKTKKVNNWPKKLFRVLVIIVLLEVIYIVIARVEHSRPNKRMYCSQAYRCQVDKDNPEYLNCVYLDENDKENAIKCPNNDYEVNSYE